MPWVPPTFWKDKNIWASALMPASLLYGRLQKTLYNTRAPYRSTLPVICIGNVQLGGSGKTPLTRTLRRLVIDAGLAVNPVVMLRGYGGDLKGPSLVDPIHHSAKDVGDEALLHAQDGATIIARDRAAGARLAESGGHDLILMDDGLQNNQLAKTLSCLVFNTDQGLGNNMVFPAGPLRETVQDALKKTGAILRVGDALPFETDLPVYNCRLIAPVASDPNRPYVAFCAIGQPEKFRQTLAGHYYNVVDFIPFADHHVFTGKELANLEQKAAAQGATLITTEKDAMRLPAGWQDKVHILKIAYQIDPADALVTQIRDALNR